MTQGQSTAPEQHRPWYYQSWFLVATFVLGWPITPWSMLWPVWAVLILRSPWHRTFPIRSLAWTMLLTGAVLMAFFLYSGKEPLPASTETVESDSGNLTATDVDGTRSLTVGLRNALRLAVPGLFLTGLTQFMWARQKLSNEIGAVPFPQPSSTSPSATPRRQRSRRRVQRRRGSRPGRSSRHPF